MEQLTDTQLDCLADVIGHLIKLARQQKSAGNVTRQDEALPAENQSKQIDRHSDSTPLPVSAQTGGGYE